MDVPILHEVPFVSLSTILVSRYVKFRSGQIIDFFFTGSYSSKTPAYPPATGGADGSLLLSSVEISREENAGLQQYYAFLSGKYNQYKSQVSAADLIQFAASVAIVSCPGGPRVQTVCRANLPKS